ncbi:MAG: protein TolR [Gammaproteobacteria bacterium]
MALNPPHHRYRKKQLAEINVVPYIDVMLVLLVIFMVTAPLLTEGVNVSLPQASARTLDQIDEKPLVVSVDAAGKFYLNTEDAPESVLDANTLINRVVAMRRLHPASPVYVRGDEHANYGQVVTVMALLQKAGVANVGLITRPANN